jgi:acyl dehydratase
MEFKVGVQYVGRMAGARQSKVNQFGRLMGTAGRIHTDPEWAAASPAGGVLVQGGLIMAPLHDLMSRLLGADRWLRRSEVAIKVVSFTRLEEPVTLTACVEQVTGDGVKFSVSWVKQDGTTVMVADINARH